MSALRAFLATLAAVLLTGCASLGLPSLGAPPLDEAHQVAALLARYERLAAAKADEQKSEFNAAQAAYEQLQNDTTRLTLALALLLPNAPWHDEARLQVLLGGIVATPGAAAPARYELAQFLLHLVAEHQREEKDEQRKLDQVLHQLREEKRKAEDLQQKLDSLRAIDKEIRQRRHTP